jgi:hypothetical protein
MQRLYVDVIPRRSVSASVPPASPPAGHQLLGKSDRVVSMCTPSARTKSLVCSKSGISPDLSIEAPANQNGAEKQRKGSGAPPHQACAVHTYVKPVNRVPMASWPEKAESSEARGKSTKRPSNSPARAARLLASPRRDDPSRFRRRMPTASREPGGGECDNISEAPRKALMALLLPS